MTQRIFLYGAGGHARVVADSLLSLSVDIGGFIDSYSKILPKLSFPVFVSLEHAQLSADDLIVIAIGSNHIRKEISLSLHFNTYSVHHPKAFISPGAYVKNGTVIMAGATINTDVIIGKFGIVNTNASIDHDCLIEDYVHISPNAALAGNVTVGEGTHIGIGACVIQGIKIGKWCTIGAGSVIINDIPDGCTVVGNPGKIIKQSPIY